MDDSTLKALLEHLPVFWWEVDEPWQVRERGGGAFTDTVTAQRFLDRMRQELAAPGHPPEEGSWQACFDGRTFDVSWPLDDDRARNRTLGVAVEVDGLSGAAPDGLAGTVPDGPSGAAASEDPPGAVPDPCGALPDAPSGAVSDAPSGAVSDGPTGARPGSPRDSPSGALPGAPSGAASEAAPGGPSEASPGAPSTAPPSTPSAAPPNATRGYAAFEGLVDLAPAAAFIRDSEGRYLWANHAYAHLYGTVPEQLIGKHIEDFDAPAEAARFRALDQEILSRGAPVRQTLGYRRPDGSAGQAVGHRFRVRENARTCVAGIYVDITDHLRATVQRQEAEENLRALRDHSGLPCALLSVNGRVVEASAAAAELFHVGLPELVGRRAHTLLAPGPGLDLDRLHRRWNGLIARRTRRVETSAVLVDADGRQRRAQLHLTTVGHSAARARHVWAVVTHQSLAHEAHPSLTAAQIRILSLLAEGSSNGDIASSLKLSRQTVDYHLSRLRDLLGAATRPALVARAYVLGILAPRAWPPRSATAAHPLSTV